jgi:hypothetical protein
MDDMYRPIDFSIISGYPHVIPEKKPLQNLPCFRRNFIKARSHVIRVSHCFYKWCHYALHEDIGMELFIMYFDDDDIDWFTKLKDNQVKTYKELIDAFMEKWNEEEPPDIKRIISNVKTCASTTPIEELIKVIKSIEFICVNQLKILEAHLVSASNYIGYSDLIELELHREHEEEFHLETLNEPMNELVTDQEETKEFEFEVIEYLDNSNPHPPPEEPISPEKIFDNLDENSEAVSLTVPLPTSQSSDDSIQYNGNMEDNFILKIPYVIGLIGKCRHKLISLDPPRSRTKQDRT